MLDLPSSLKYGDVGDSCLILPHSTCYQSSYTNTLYISLLVAPPGAADGVVRVADTSGVWELNPLGPPTLKHALVVMSFR